MSTPAIRPARMAKYRPRCSLPSREITSGQAMMAMRIADRLVPRDRAFSRVRWSACSSVRTKKVPMMEQMMPMAAMTMGMAMALKA